ncbi:MAG: 3-phosphoserine/phosphohydroxythreonine transaminase [Chthonomonas sp.]|nr:3-phosphoserine/phosphohydroxythreonine transaminase [Chthonomonas sp.]
MSQPYERVYNFSAGPCTLPVAVLEQVRDDLINYKGTGKSVMEMSHRSKAYEAIIAQTEADLRTLMGIPEAYKVLFLQGGASLQFTMLANSFLPAGKTAEYIVTGTWGKKAVEAAQLVGNVKVVFDAKADNYNHAPHLTDLNLSAYAAYVHFTSNETIQGVDFFADPAVAGRVICDASSNILSRPMDVSKYCMLYAGAQKNMGPAGVTVVIMHEDLIREAPTGLAPMLDYRLQSENGSMYNTPPCFSIYVMGLVYQWTLAQGGLTAMAKHNAAKAGLLYDAIEASGGFYEAHAKPANRSHMNVTFTLPSDDLTDAFIKAAKENKFEELKGHRSVGGCRASIYNAFPTEGCEELARFMREFASANG